MQKKHLIATYLLVFLLVATPLYASRITASHSTLLPINPSLDTGTTIMPNDSVPSAHNIGFSDTSSRICQGVLDECPLTQGYVKTITENYVLIPQDIIILITLFRTEKCGFISCDNDTLCFTHTQKSLLPIESNYTLKIWCSDTKKTICDLPLEKDKNKFSNGTIDVSHLTPEQAFRLFNEYNYFPSLIKSIQWPHNTPFISLLYDKKVKILNLGDWENSFCLSSKTKIRRIAWEEGRYLVTCCEGGALSVWDIPQKLRIKRIDHPDTIFQIHWSNDGKSLFYLSGGCIYMMRLFEEESSSKPIKIIDSVINGFAIHFKCIPESEKLAILFIHVIPYKQSSLNPKKSLMTYEYKKRRLSFLLRETDISDFCLQGRKLFFSSGSKITILDTETKKCLKTLEQDERIIDMKVRSQYIASITAKHIRIWDHQTYQCLYAFRLNDDDKAIAIKWDRQGERLAVKFIRTKQGELFIIRKKKERWIGNEINILRPRAFCWKK